MSKAKRKILKDAKKREKIGDGNIREAVKISVSDSDLSESAARDAGVIGQMLNDYPFDENVNFYFAEAMGVQMIDLPKKSAVEMLKKSLPESSSAQITENVEKSRLLVIRLKA